MECSAKLGTASINEYEQLPEMNGLKPMMKLFLIIAALCLSESSALAGRDDDFFLDQYDDAEIELVKDMCVRDRRINQDMGLSVFSPTAIRVIAEGMVTNGEFLNVESGRAKLKEYQKLKSYICPDVW